MNNLVQCNFTKKMGVIDSFPKDDFILVLLNMALYNASFVIAILVKPKLRIVCFIFRRYSL